MFWYFKSRIYSTKTLTNNNIHYAEGLSHLCGLKQSFFQSSQSSITKFLYYCFNIVLWTWISFYVGCDVIFVVNKFVKFRCIIYTQLLMFVFRKNTIHWNCSVNEILCEIDIVQSLFCTNLRKENMDTLKERNDQKLGLLKDERRIIFCYIIVKKWKWYLKKER